MTLLHCKYLQEIAYMRKRPVYGRSTRSTNSKAVTIKNHQKQSNYQVREESSLSLCCYRNTNTLFPQLQNDNKSLDFVYYSESEDEQEGWCPTDQDRTV